jgi:hypothetical protein
MAEVDYEARKRPEVYKPLYGAAFAELARFAGADLEAVQAGLDGIDATQMGPWGYLLAAVSATRPLVFTDKVQEALGSRWARQLWEPSNNPPELSLPRDEDEVEDEDGPDLFNEWETERIVAVDYPEKAQEALAQDFFWGGSGADVLGIWQKDGIAKVFHAHYEGFWILGEDPVDYFEKVVAQIVGAG